MPHTVAEILDQADELAARFEAHETDPTCHPITQLRGDAGERQAKNADTAVVSNGGGAPGGCFLFTAAR